ncbi:MAG: hypothetical protein JNJ73_13870 [Hyphomonadaceae bacterium]|nr:hypothetical protein [Hyphomonadaceae bacterium]
MQRLCAEALERMLTHRGDAGALVDQALRADPACVRAHCLRAALIVAGDDEAARPALAASLDLIEATVADERDPARRHAAAARAWLEGGAAAGVQRYGALVVEQPYDILALHVAHALDFRLGRRTMLRDRIAQVLPEWDPAAPGYASILAMYAFGLEENGEYRGAEKVARRALALDPAHLGAVHVVAHVLEMQGRAREGLAFLAETEAAWPEAHGFSVHLAWHRALFHFDADDAEAALAVYDAEIANAPASSISALADASALLWRIHLRGFDVADRWRRLADRWERHSLAGARAFFIVHAMMAFAQTDRVAAAARALQALPAGSAATAPDEDVLAPPLTRALLAFARDDYAACIDWLVQVRHIADRCGGSVAQCDLIHLTYTEAAFRARENGLARALVAERAALRPRSRLNRILEKRLQAMPGAAGRAALVA